TRLQNFVKAINLYDVTCGDDNLISDSVNQEVGTAALPPLPSDAKNRASIKTLGEAYVFKKLKGITKSRSWKAPMPVLSVVSSPTFDVAAMVGEFAPDITSAPAKRPIASDALESTVGSSHDTVSLLDDSTSIKTGFEHRHSSKEITKATNFMSLESTHSQPLGGRDCSFLKVGEKISSEELAKLRLGKEEDKFGTLVNLASDPTCSTGGRVDQFIITLSISYAREVSAFTIKSIAHEEKKIVDFGVDTIQDFKKMHQGITAAG
nr:hypothetical protein [Tanacetum cinerariifolium]